MVNFGILGFGLHAVKRLMPGFAKAKNCRVVGLSRRDVDKAQASAREFKIPLAFDSAEELCRAPEVDAVFIATPNACHLNDVLLAIRYGKPVLCEKPMAMHADECRRMVEAAHAANILLGVAQVFRFEETTAVLRARVAAGQIGKPIIARSEFSFPAEHGHPRTWIHDPAVAGGGPIADVGVHCIDALRFVLQDEVVRVTARAFFGDVPRQVEHGASLILEFAKGTMATVMVSFCASYRTPLELVGEKAALFANDALNVERPIEIELRDGANIIERETVSNRLAYARQVDAFAAAVEGKAAFPVPGIEGWKNQEVLDAAYRSVKSGKGEEVRAIGRG